MTALLVAGLVTLGLLLPVHRPVLSHHDAASSKQRPAPSSRLPSDAAAEKAAEAYAKLPLGFVENTGQVDEAVRYYAQGAGFSFSFAREKATLSLLPRSRSGPRPELETSWPATSPDALQASRMTLALQFLGANPGTTVAGEAPAAGKVNYLIGDDPARWRTGLPTYQRIVYRELWPGIDMVFRGAGGTLKYEFLVRPGARVEDIALAYRGAQGLTLDPAGGLVIRTPLGLLSDSRPVSYQRLGGRQVPVPSRFVLTPGSNSTQYGFAVDAGYDPRHMLVIDPGLVYSTYLGGTGLDRGLDIAVDGNGSAYVAGDTFSANFPTTPGSFKTAGPDGGRDAFVAKLNPAGSALVYSTYLGGNGFNDVAHSIAIDGAGNAYVTGQTDSSNWPTTAGAFDTTFNGTRDAFVTKLNPAGSALVYSTYLGGSGLDVGAGLAVDGNGNVYVAGGTDSANFPTTAGAFDTTPNGADDAIVAKLNPTGSALVYSTYLGGSSFDGSSDVAIDAAGNAYTVGNTGSTDFPTTAGAFDTTFNGGAPDGHVTKLNPAGSALVYATYLGSSGVDTAIEVAVDQNDSAYVTGQAGAANFPTTSGAFDTTFNGGIGDGYVTKLNPAGSALGYSTYLGGSGNESGSAIALDQARRAHILGLTDSVNFPTTPSAFQATDPDLTGFDAFVTVLNPAGSTLDYSTYLGGTGEDSTTGMALDGNGDVYVTGQTRSPNYPTTPGSFQATDPDPAGTDGFVTKLTPGGEPATLTLAPKQATNTVGTPHTVTATVKDAAGNPVQGVTVRFSVTGANSASGAAATDANGQASFTYTGTTSGSDTIDAFADSDNDGTQDVGEPSDTATKTWTPGPPAALTLAPAADTNTVGTEHCVTATVTDVFGNPVPGVTVVFSVPTSVATHASPSSGSAVTDASGEARFCFTASLPGQDAIHAFADTDQDGQQDPTEPFGDATKTWTLPPNTALCEVKITEGGWIIANNGDRASFGGNAKVSADGSSVQGQQQYQDHGPAQPRNVHSIELTAVTCSDDLTSATIFGTATIDGSGTFVFRIDVIDQGEPGTNDAYGIILSDGYASGQQQLRGGNVKIHKS